MPVWSLMDYTRILLSVIELEVHFEAYTIKNDSESIYHRRLVFSSKLPGHPTDHYPVDTKKDTLDFQEVINRLHANFNELTLRCSHGRESLEIRQPALLELEISSRVSGENRKYD